jgi:hypothetical protein
MKLGGVRADDLREYLSRTDITYEQRRLAELRLEYSEIGTIRTAQIKALETPRLYPTILPIQVTGRWTYLRPNYNSFSKRCINPVCPEGQHSKSVDCWSVSDCIRPDTNTFWIEHDLDAVEHRIYCLVLQWRERLEQLRAGEDIHTPVACELFQLPLPTDPYNPHSSEVDKAWRETVGWQGKDDQRRTLGKNMTYGGQFFYVRMARANEQIHRPYRIYQGLWYNPTYVYTIPHIQTFKVLHPETGELKAPDFEEIACRFVESSIEIQKRKAYVQEKCRRDGFSRNLYGAKRRTWRSEFYRNQENAKELFNYIVQSTVSSYINESAILIQHEFPESYCIHNKCDSLKWAFPYCSVVNRAQEEQEVLATVQELSQRTLLMGQYDIPITATFKIIRREDDKLSSHTA